MYAERTIKDGVLQIVASQLVGQMLQERAGETELRDGISKVFDARAKHHKYWGPKRSAPAKPARKMRKLAARRFGSKLGKRNDSEPVL
jgi:hypothetical protein